MCIQSDGTANGNHHEKITIIAMQSTLKNRPEKKITDFCFRNYLYGRGGKNQLRALLCQGSVLNR